MNSPVFSGEVDPSYDAGVAMIPANKDAASYRFSAPPEFGDLAAVASCVGNPNSCATCLSNCGF